MENLEATYVQYMLVAISKLERLCFLKLGENTDYMKVVDTSNGRIYGPNADTLLVKVELISSVLTINHTPF